MNSEDCQDLAFLDYLCDKYQNFQAVNHLLKPGKKYSLLSTGSTQEDRKSSQHDWKIIDWDMKHKKNNKKKQTANKVNRFHFLLSKSGFSFSESKAIIAYRYTTLLNPFLHKNDPFERSCIWKYYGKWGRSKMLFFSIIFSKIF